VIQDDDIAEKKEKNFCVLSVLGVRILILHSFYLSILKSFLYICMTTDQQDGNATMHLKIIIMLALGILLSACTRQFRIGIKAVPAESKIDTLTLIFPHVQYYENAGDEKDARRGHSRHGLKWDMYLVDKDGTKIIWHNGNYEKDKHYNPTQKGELHVLCVSLLASLNIN